MKLACGRQEWEFSFTKYGFRIKCGMTDNKKIKIENMDLPKFLLADNSNLPEDIFVLHTEYPRFLINLKDDEIEWFEDLSGENEEDIAEELADLMDKAGEFYDTEMKQFE
jgi:hypothetical protein